MTSRQITFTNLIPVVRNDGGFFPFEGTITTGFKFKTWNMTAEWTPEFYGSAFDTALSGRVRSNFRGYRLKVSLQLDNSTESEKIRDLFNYLSGGFDRTFYALTTNGTGSGATALVLTSGAPATNDYFNGLVISGLTGGDVVVTDYVGSSRTATLKATRTWTNALAITAKAKPNIATNILFHLDGTATTYTDSNLVPCIIVNNNYGVTRQSTIQQQRISIEMESIDLYSSIPEAYRIA